MNPETDVSINFTSKVNGNTKLEKLAKSLATIKVMSEGINTGVINSLETSADATKEIAKNTTQMSNTMKLAFNFSTTRMFARTLANVSRELTRLANKSSEYLENVNLFQVAFDGSYQSAERFVNKITEMYGLDESRITRVVGIFKQLGNAMNVSAETGERLATLMTQMSLDISSLYNVDFERATSVLQSAFSGQTKPIRGTTGADITQSTLQTTLDSLGIEKMVSDLTFAEKRLLIIISLTQQLKEATNDLGRTIESPANQLKVLSEQWQRLSRALGNTFLPILSKILPYLNAIMMVLTAIINMIAKLFGYKKDDYDYFSGTSDAVMDLEDSLGKATAGVGKLKKALSGLRGFDKLNVISTPSSGGAGGGSGTGGTGISGDILKAFNDAYDSYNQKLSDVQMKAAKIRDSIMEWLGFTKEIDPLTGEISWKYQGLGTTLKNMATWFWDLSLPAKIIVGYVAFLIGSKVYNGFKAIFDLFTKTKLAKMLNSLIEPVKILGMFVKENILAKTMTFGTAIATSINQWAGTLTTVERLKVSLVGAGGIYASLQLVNDAMKRIKENGEATTGSILELGGGMLGTIGSATLMGAQFGTTGAIIGGVVGTVSAVTQAFYDWIDAETAEEKAAREHREEVKKYTDELKEQYKAINDNYTLLMSQQEGNQILVDELKTLVDENGRVKSGYEDRVQFITTHLNNAYGTEMQLIDGVIQKYGEEIDNIQKIIDKKKEEIYLNMAQEQYEIALKNRLTVSKNLKEAQDNYNQALAAYNAIEDKSSEEAKAFKGILDQTKTTLDEQKEAFELNEQAIDNYSGMLTASAKGDKEAVEKYMAAIEDQYTQTTNGVKTTLTDRVNYATQERQRDLENAKKVNGEITQDTIDNANKRYTEVTGLLLNEKNYIDGISDDYVDAWYQLAQDSEETFINNFKELPDDVQQQVVDKMYDKGYNITEEMQKGMDGVDLTKIVTVDADTSSAVKNINKLMNNKDIQNFGNALKNVGVKINFTQNAGGGLPPVGQLFVANEKGPELIGQIGGQSFVANQKEIVDFMDRKIQTSNNGGGSQVYNIYLDEYHKIGSYTLEQLQGMAKTNGKPIQIG